MVKNIIDAKGTYKSLSIDYYKIDKIIKTMTIYINQQNGFELKGIGYFSNKNKKIRFNLTGGIDKYHVIILFSRLGKISMIPKNEKQFHFVSDNCHIIPGYLLLNKISNLIID